MSRTSEDRKGDAIKGPKRAPTPKAKWRACIQDSFSFPHIFTRCISEAAKMNSDCRVRAQNPSMTSLCDHLGRLLESSKSLDKLGFGIKHHRLIFRIHTVLCFCPVSPLVNFFLRQIWIQKKFCLIPESNAMPKIPPMVNVVASAGMLLQNGTSRYSNPQRPRKTRFANQAFTRRIKKAPRNAPSIPPIFKKGHFWDCQSNSCFSVCFAFFLLGQDVKLKTKRSFT